MLISPQKKAQTIAKILAQLYPTPPIPLNHRSPFELLVAVVLSGHSTDKMVNRVTPVLFELADTPQKMARLSIDQIQLIIRPVGLSPTKAKHLKALSEILVKRHGGNVPSTFDELEVLPGVGHKTASVVMSQAFGLPAFPVDTHIHRLAHRWGLSDGKNVAQTEKDLKRLFPKEQWNLLHLRMIYFGREFCPARGHDSKVCPICGLFG